MGSRGGQQTTTTQAVDPTISRFVNQFILPSFGQPGFTTPQIPGNFPIGAGPDPLSLAAQQGFTSFLSGPFQQQFGNLQGGANSVFNMGFGALGQGIAGVPQAQQFALSGLNPFLNPVLGFNANLSDEASGAFQRLLSGNPFGGPEGNTFNVGGGGGSFIFDRGGGAAPRIDPQEVIDTTTKALTDNFFERVMPDLTSGLIGTGNLGSSRGEIIAGNALEDFNQTLAQEIARIKLGAESQNAANATQLAAARSSASGQLGASRIAQQGATQRAALEAMLQAATGVQGGLVSGFNPFFGGAQDALMRGSQFLGNLGSGLTGQGLNFGQSLLGMPLQQLQGLNAFGLQNQGIFDQIVQRALPLWLSNQTTGLQDLQNYAGMLGPLFGGSGTTTQTGPGRSIGGGILGGASAGAGIATALSLSTPWGAGLAAAGGLLGAFG